MRSILDAIPLNGSKTYLGIVLGALVLGLTQMGYIDPNASGKLMEWIGLWTGMALAHKVDKSISGTVTP